MVVVPTVTEENSDDFRRNAAALAEFCGRLHLDFADGDFAPRRLVGLSELDNLPATTNDLHLMYRRPRDYLDAIAKLQPSLVIVHAEAEGVDEDLFDAIRRLGARAGVALLPETTVESVSNLCLAADHALIFGGRLGWQGGAIDLSQTAKVEQIRKYSPNVEIAWDGGVNDVNIEQLKTANIDVVNVGSFIQQAARPRDAYAILQQIANS